MDINVAQLMKLFVGDGTRNDLLVSIQNATDLTFKVRYNVEHGATNSVGPVEYGDDGQPFAGSGNLCGPKIVDSDGKIYSNDYDIGVSAIGRGSNIFLYLEGSNNVRVSLIAATPPNNENYLRGLGFWNETHTFEQAKGWSESCSQHVSGSGWAEQTEAFFGVKVSTMITGDSPAVCHIWLTPA